MDEERISTKEFLKQRVLKRIEAAGGKAYFVGGCVRDSIIGRIVNDYDIATDLPPETLRKVFDGHLAKLSENSERFGVTIILIPYDEEMPDNFFEVEIATFRKDITKGRHPEVVYSDSIYEDAQRRDFTINALYEDADGEIHDPTGMGLKDIDNNILRFVGDARKRLEEDPLRAYRFVRFLSYGFDTPYKDDDYRSMKEVIDFSGVSKERKLKEIEKTMSSKHFRPYNSAAYNAALKLGVFADMGLLPILNEMVSVRQSFKWHAEGAIVRNVNTNETVYAHKYMDFSQVEPVKLGDVFDHTLSVWHEMNKILFQEGGIVGGLPVPVDAHTRFLLILSAILHDIGKAHSDLGDKENVYELGGRTIKETVKRVHDHDVVGAPIAKEFCRNLGMSNDDIEFVGYMVATHMTAHKLREMKSRYKIMKLVHHKWFNELMLLAMADARGSIHSVDDGSISLEEALDRGIVVECCSEPMPERVLTGDDLIEAGFKPGPKFGDMLETAYRIQIDNYQTSKKYLLDRVKGMAS